MYCDSRYADNNDCLIGFTGFVGSTLLLQRDYRWQYNSKNISDIGKREYDTVVCAGIAANKWWANQNADADMAAIRGLMEALEMVKCKRFILVSTIDVYPQQGCNEDIIVENSAHPYGTNRLSMERFVRARWPNSYHIVRLPGLFGYSLKKNIIYDLVNDNCLQELDIASEFQWYWVHDLEKDLYKMIEMGIRELNLFTEPIKTRQILETVARYKNVDTVATVEKGSIKYSGKTKYGNGGWWRSKEYVLEHLDHYLHCLLKPRLALSTLANTGTAADFDVLYTKLKNDFGLRCKEIAPHSYLGSNWKTMLKHDRGAFRRLLGNVGSMQAVLYPLSNNLFGSTDERHELRAHMRCVIELASEIGAKQIVFGAPKNRKIPVGMDIGAAQDIAVEFFRDLGNFAHNNGVIVCMEPNARYYGCNFLWNTNNTAAFVDKVSSAGFALMLDVGNMQLEGEPILETLEKYIDKIAHFHFSSKDLKSLTTNDHTVFPQILQKYTGTITVEIKDCSELEIKRSLYTCLRCHCKA